MKDYSLLRDYAFFADAAYVDHNSSLPTVGNSIDAIQAQERVPSAISETILGSGLNQYEVAHHDHSQNESTGFAATVFRNGDEFVLSIRGSEKLGIGEPQNYHDWITSNAIGIGRYGVAVDQAISLFNYIQQLRTPIGEQAFQLDLVFTVLDYQIIAKEPAPGLGVLQSGDTIDVVGHSLGGHLAIVAKRIFPSLFNEVYSFNGANFGLNAETFFQELNSVLFDNGQSFFAASSFDVLDSQVTRATSEDSAPGDDADIVPGSVTGTKKVGQEIFVRTEVNSHSVGQMLDGLSILALLEKLGDNTDAVGIFDAASNDPGASQEEIIKQLYLLFKGSEPPLSQSQANSFGAGDFDKRVTFYDVYTELEAIIDGILESNPSAVTLVSLAGLNADDVAGRAKAEVAYRYALVNLLPFAVIDFSGAFSVYDHLQYDADNFSQAYLNDRAEMLTLLLTRNAADTATNESVDEDLDVALYVDKFTNQSLTTGAVTVGNANDTTNRIYFGGEVADCPVDGFDGKGGDDRLYGRGGNDELQGRAGSDYIEGNEGNDNLHGGEDRDYLYGGAGKDILSGGDDQEADTYHYALVDRVFLTFLYLRAA